MMEKNLWYLKLANHGHWMAIFETLNLDYLIGVINNPGDFPNIPFRFECAPDPEKVFHVFHCPKFLRNRWLKIIQQYEKKLNADFFEYMAGPGSWLLTRLVRFSEVVYWSPRGLGPFPIDGPEYPQLKINFSPQVAGFFSNNNGPESLYPRRIYLSNNYFLDVFSTFFPLAFSGPWGCFVADSDAQEVYWINNDEIISLSITNEKNREKINNELKNAPYPFRNVSGTFVSEKEREREIKKRQLILTNMAFEQMEEKKIDIFDLQSAILTGNIVQILPPNHGPGYFHFSFFGKDKNTNPLGFNFYFVENNQFVITDIIK